MRSIVIGFGLLILCMVILFKIGEVNFTEGNVSLEVIVAIAAFIFFFVGLCFNYQSQRNNSERKEESNGSGIIMENLSIYSIREDKKLNYGNPLKGYLLKLVEKDDQINCEEIHNLKIVL